MPGNPKAQARDGYAQRRLQGEALLRTRLHHAEQRVQQLGGALADVLGQQQALQVSEPLTYGPHSPASWFLDVYRVKRGDGGESRARLDAHDREMARLAPQRAEARARKAAEAAERALTGTPQERRALEAFTGAGGILFERRAATRVDGQGGYFVPPAWLIDRAVPPARADAALASAITTLPLPELCDTVNLPAIRTGTAAGVQSADLGVTASRDVADSFVTGRVISIAGTVDVSAQWFDQGSGGAGAQVDAMIWDDLHADALLTLDGLALLGSGINGQTLGLLPPQTAFSTSLAVYAPNGNTTAGQSVWYNGGSGTTLGTTIAQCVSGVTRARAKRPTHLLTHPWYFDLLTAQADQQARPYVEPKGPNLVPDGAQLPPGVVGYSHGLPILGDANMPTTFGGTAAPYLGTVNGTQYTVQPGTGAAALYTPVLPIVADDVFAFTGEPKMRLLAEVLSGAAQYRFQLYQYVTVLPHRYQAVAAGTLPNSGGWAVGAISSYGIATQQGSNSLLSISGQGF